MKNTMLVVLMIVLLFSACNKAEKPQEQADNTQASVVPEEKTSEDSTSTFKQLVMKKSTISFQVEYEVTSTASGKTIRTTTSQFVKGKQLRSDSTTGGVETRMYVKENKIDTCMNRGSWSCFSVPQQQKAGDEAVRDVESNPEKYKIEKLPNKSIAGTTAVCFRMSSKITMDYCLSPEGVALYMKFAEENYASEMIAKSYSLSVPDSVFVLPTESQDLGSMMDGFDPSKLQQS